VIVDAALGLPFTPGRMKIFSLGTRSSTIDPVECTDCGACVPVCPVPAIFAADDVPEKWNQYTQKNAEYYNR
jgi:NAD-dependent dihydropyrimidine dehydrogenase PreA subunit